MNDTDIHAAGQLLYRQHHRDEVFSLMTSPLAPETLDEAYDIQDVYTSLLAGDDPESQGAFAGYKIAYTSPVMQQRLGTTEPAFGRLLAREVLDSPASVYAANYQGLEVECEVAVRLCDDLPGGDHSEKKVFDAVGEIMIAFEIVNRRRFEGRPSLVQSVAMNVIMRVPSPGIRSGSGNLLILAVAARCCKLTGPRWHKPRAKTSPGIP